MKSIAVHEDVHAGLKGICDDGCMVLSTLTSGILREWLQKTRVKIPDGVLVIRREGNKLDEDLKKSSNDLENNPEKCVSRVRVAQIDLEAREARA